MNGSDRLRQVLAVFMGGIFVAAGLMLMFGEEQTASASTGSEQSSTTMFTELSGYLGDGGAGALLILFGFCLSAMLIRSVSR